MMKSMRRACALALLGAVLLTGPVYADDPGRDWGASQGFGTEADRTLILRRALEREARREGQIGQQVTVNDHSTTTIVTECQVENACLTGGEGDILVGVTSVTANGRNNVTVDNGAEGVDVDQQIVPVGGAEGDVNFQGDS